jgi:predicted RNA-binding Zn ribbon-like protein
MADSLELALDFANTSGWGPGTSADDRLKGYEEALAWATGEGVVNEVQAGSLRRLALAQPDQLGEALLRVVELRRAIYRLFAAVAHRRDPEGVDLEVLNRALAESMGHMRVTHTTAGGDGPSFDWSWSGLDTELKAPLWPVARAAAALLTSPQLVRVRDCADESCGFLFIDHSKNASRRWCDMGECGNQAKARRFRERKRSGSDL